MFLSFSSLRNCMVTLAATTIAGVCGSSFAATERIGDFALLDEEGRFHQLSRYQHRDAVVMLAFNAQCAAAVEAVKQFSGMQEQFGKNIEFLALDVTGLSRERRKELALSVPLLGDEMTLVSESLNISQAGEVLVFNPERMALFYRGGMSAALETSLSEIAAGNAPSDTVTGALSGCAVDYPDLARHKENPPDYSSQVAPVVVENCAICHRAGGAGPFPFDSYVSLLGWSPMVREVILNKRMPPMQVDPEIGGSGNAHSISAEDRQILLHWMQAGAPRGDGLIDPLEEIPLEKAFEWQLGEPDYLVEAPTNVVPAVGIQDYEYFEIDLPFSEDKWVRAFQYAPGDERVLHHLMAFVVGPEEDFWGPEKNDKTAVRRFLGSFIPGENPATIFPEGSGVRIPAGHKLALQFHYVSNGLKVSDKTSIGLYFSEAVPKHEILTRSVAERFVIAPGNPEHPITASFTFDQRVKLLAVRARMNYRGKHMRFTVRDGNGDKENVFSIPAYNYGWQPHYWLNEPRVLEQGSTMLVEGAFDNSLSNPFNPDPREEVNWGLGSREEMFTGYLTYYVDE